MHTKSCWSATHAFPDFPAIDRDIEVEAVVVEAGLTSITTSKAVSNARGYGALCPPSYPWGCLCLSVTEAS